MEAAGYSYRTTIIWPEEVIENIDGEDKIITQVRYLPLDLQKSKNVRASSEVISNPMKNGDTMSDHMYRNPSTVTLSGTFSLNGRYGRDKSYDFIFDGEKFNNVSQDSLDRLTKIEATFEHIKNTGTLVDIVSIATDNGSNNIDSSKSRFLWRRNMALADISWTENQNSIEFDFTFKEIILVKQKTYEYNNYDPDLPEFYQPPASSIGTLFADSDQLPQIVIESLYRHNYLNGELLKFLSGWAAGAGIWCAGALAITAATLGVIGIGVAITAMAVTTTTVAATAAGITITTAGSTLAAISGATAGAIPIGTIIAATVVAVAAIGYGIYKIVKWRKKQLQKAKISKWRSKIKNHPEKFTDMMDNVMITLNESNLGVQIYNFTSSKDQTICISIGGSWYYLQFTSNESDPNYWSAKVFEGSLDPQDELAIKSKNCLRNNWSVVTNIYDMDPSENCWFKDITKKYQVYICNPALADEINDTTAKKNVVKKNLQQYTIWVSEGDIKDYTKQLGKIIDKAVLDNI